MGLLMAAFCTSWFEKTLGQGSCDVLVMASSRARRQALGFSRRRLASGSGREGPVPNSGTALDGVVHLSLLPPQ